jgi:hypothetical protein
MKGAVMLFGPQTGMPIRILWQAEKLLLFA